MTLFTCRENWNRVDTITETETGAAFDHTIQTFRVRMHGHATGAVSRVQTYTVRQFALDRKLSGNSGNDDRKATDELSPFMQFTVCVLSTAILLQAV